MMWDVYGVVYEGLDGNAFIEQLDYLMARKLNWLEIWKITFFSLHHCNLFTLLYFVSLKKLSFIWNKYT